MDRIPYHQANNYEEIEKLIQDGILPEVPENIPDDFKSIIKSLWILEPANRKTAQSIVLQNPWTKIYRDTLPADKDIKSIWDKIAISSQSPEANKLKWGDFTTHFWKILATNYDPIHSDQAECLKKLLSEPDGIVSRERFEKFTDTFSPFMINSQSNIKYYFSQLVKLCKKPWFYGIISRTNAELILNHLKRVKKVKNPVVVRISENSGYVFCVNTIDYFDKEKRENEEPEPPSNNNSPGKEIKGKIILHQIHPPVLYKRDQDFYTYLKQVVKKYDHSKGYKGGKNFQFGGQPAGREPKKSIYYLEDEVQALTRSEK
jgi:hypothetical protein